MSVCLIGLGSNQGDRRTTLAAATAEIARLPQLHILAQSAWRETSPVGGPSGQPMFLNGAIRAETSLDPYALLTYLQQIEQRLGRRREERWGPRAIDLDLLLYDDLVLHEPTLTLPHPRMAWRRFVLEPAAEIAGEMRHPEIRWTIAKLLEHLNTARPYVAVTGPIAVGKTQLVERFAATISARKIMEQPDWGRLDAFYAEPAVHGLETELVFLCQRAGLLAADMQAWSESRWTVSDFWFEQSAAFARAWLSDAQLPTFFEQYELLRKNVVRPKLIVLLDLPAEKLFDRMRQRGRACEQRLTLRQLDRIRDAVRVQTEQPDVGPVLRVDAEQMDTEAAFAAVLAAVRGME
jgi:2-amino-4-hydroxy-6-hydroxymethyldihydropteridine diphosphokinase